MSQKNKLVGYRAMLGKTQKEMADAMGISRQSYYLKEKGDIAFSDNEKSIFKKMLIPLFPTITIDELFFNQNVSK